MRAIALPVKSLSHAKSRLAPLLSPLERGALALAMFEDALDAALAVDGWETWVVSSDESVLEIALGRGAMGIPEEEPASTERSRRSRPRPPRRPGGARDPPRGHAADRGRRAPRDPAHARTGRDRPVRGRARDQPPVRRPPAAIPSRFGPDSFRRHLEVAAERPPDRGRGARRARVRPGRSRRYPHRAGDPAPGRTLEVCRDLDLPERLAARA